MEETEDQKTSTQPPAGGTLDELGALLRELGANPNNPYRTTNPTEVSVPRSLLILTLRVGAHALIKNAERNVPIAGPASIAGAASKEAQHAMLAGLGALGMQAVAAALEGDPTVTAIRLISEEVGSRPTDPEK